jgi:hypothetical protein
MTNVFVDCEAPFGKGSPAVADMTEFGAVINKTTTFHGDIGMFLADQRGTMQMFSSWLKRECKDGPPIFWSDNPAFDWQWINFYFWKYGIDNPFGFSARRIGDYYAGLVGDVRKGSDWKKMRITPHTHNPVDDAMGNYEAFERMQRGERAK